jgi:hypothetical protein
MPKRLLNIAMGWDLAPIEGRSSKGQPDTHCQNCGAGASKAESRWYENPDPITGEFPFYLCAKCAWEEEKFYRREAEYEAWLDEQHRHEREKPALREQDVEVLDDYRAAPRF